MNNRHLCEKLKNNNDAYDRDNEDTTASISRDEKGWFLFLYDGNGVSIGVGYCPFCGERLA